MAGDGVCSVGRLSRSAALVGLWRRRPGGRSSAAGGGGAPAASSERRAAAVVAAQASEEVCGASGCAAAATPVQMPLLLHTRLPRLPVLAGRCVLLLSTRSVQSSLPSNVYAVSHGAWCPKRARFCSALGSPFWTAHRAAPVPPQTRLPSTQWSSLGAQGCAWSTGEAKCASAARRHPHKPPHRHTPPPRRLEGSTHHNLQNKLEVHPREPFLPGQIDEALARARTGQQRRPRLIQFEPHALAIPPQDQGRPV